MFFSLRRVRSVSSESCAWSCGALSRLFWALRCPYPRCLHLEVEPGCSRDAMVGFCNTRLLHSVSCLLPSCVCCLSCLLNIQVRHGLLIGVKSVATITSAVEDLQKILERKVDSAVRGECWSCGAGFRHSASLHARVILDGATCRPRELWDVRGVLSVLGVW